MARPEIGATLGAPAVWGQLLVGAVVTVVDPLTVTITTLEPIADLLDIIAAGPVLPPLALEAPVLLLGGFLSQSARRSPILSYLRPRFG